MSKQWAQKKSGSNSSLPVQKSSSSQRPFTAPVYDAPAPKQTPSVQAKRRNVDWNRVTVEAQSPAGVQAKLSVGAPGDKYEQEADATANKVMTMPAPEKEKPVQREMASEEKEEEVQTKPLADGIQREMAPEEKEEEVQTKLATEGKSQAGSNLESQLSGTKGGGSALSDEVRSHMEPRFGANSSSVRVHTDSAAVQMNRDLGAQAFTQRAPLIQRMRGKKTIEKAKNWLRSKRGGGNESQAEEPALQPAEEQALQQAEEPAEDIEQVNPENFGDYMELTHIEGRATPIPGLTEAGHTFTVQFTLRNKTEKTIEFTDIPPVEWIETENKVAENTPPEVRPKTDKYQENRDSQTFRWWRSGFTNNQRRWHPGEERKVFIQDVPRLRGINEDGQAPRTVKRTLTFDIGVPGTGPRLKATQYINVVEGAKKNQSLTIG